MFRYSFFKIILKSFVSGEVDVEGIIKSLDSQACIKIFSYPTVIGFILTEGYFLNFPF